MKRHAVALLSGGLDSMLAVRLLLDQGVPVTAVRFITHFGCDPVTSGSCGRDVEPLVKMWGPLGLTIKMCHLGQDYIEMVKNPKFGRGKNMNPCVDCRIMMLRWAHEMLDQTGAGFLITGEVLNQRPMSQTRERFRQIDRELGLKGLVLRPLSAKLLDPTLPEIEGVVDRTRLLDFSGRGRTRQYELAEHWGVTDIPQPAGGCLLTDPGYSARLKDLWGHDPSAGARDINLLRAGRHFRTSPNCKIVVGRNENENRMIDAFAERGDTLVYLLDHEGPLTLLRGSSTAEDVVLAASLTARYGDVPDKTLPVQVVVARKGGVPYCVEAVAAREEEYVPKRVAAETPKLPTPKSQETPKSQAPKM